MFDLVGLSAKPGHLLKFKKGLASYVLNRDCTTSTAAKEINNRTETPVPQIKVQKSKLVFNTIFNFFPHIRQFSI